MFCPAVYRYRIRRVFKPVVTLKFGANSFFQLYYARTGGRVLGKAILDSANRYFLDVIGRVKVGFASLECHNVDTFALERCRPR